MPATLNGRVDYHEYINSPQWRMKANQAKQRAGYRCQVCNRPSSQVTLDAHHRTYERLGHELPEDITVLCRDCHSLYETSKRLPKPPARQATPIREQLVEQQVPAAHFTLIEPEERNTSGDIEDTTIEDDPKPSRHLLTRFGQAIHVLGYTGNGILLITLEWSLVLNNWIELINPMFHLRVVGTLLFSPIFWQLVIITIAGVLLTVCGAYTAGLVRPKNGALKWFWRWSGTAIIRVPFFILVLWMGWYALTGVISSILIVVSQQLSVFDFPLLVPVVRLYVVLLPIPIVHLIWSNRFRNGWGKFAITVVSLVVLVLLQLAVEVWWGRTLCANSVMSTSDCQGFERAVSLPRILIESWQLGRSSQSETTISDLDKRESETQSATISTPSEQSGSGLTPAAPEKYYYVIGDTEVRKGPGTNYAIVRTVQAAEPIQVIDCNDPCTWYKLDIGQWLPVDAVMEVAGSLRVGDTTPTSTPTEPVPTGTPTATTTPTPTRQPPTATATPTPRGCPGGCIVYPSWCAPPIKGNISFESKEKIYHVPGQKYYDSTTINPRYGERWFCTEEEARAAGWRKSRR